VTMYDVVRAIRLPGEQHFPASVDALVCWLWVEEVYLA